MTIQVKPITFLKINTSLKVDQRKFINFLVDQLTVEFRAASISKKLWKKPIPIEVNRFDLHKALDMEGRTKFRLSKVVNELINTKFYIGSHNRSGFINQLSLDTKHITLALNPIYNQYLAEDNIFSIDQYVQNKITRKNTLFFYELCMYFLCMEKFKQGRRIKKGSELIYNISISESLLVLGKDNYKNMRNLDIYRHVFKVASKDLNAFNTGFTVSVESKLVYRTVDSVDIKIVIEDEDYLMKYIK